MKTEKGNTFTSLLDIHVEDKILALTLNSAVPFQTTADDEHAKMVMFITDIVQREKKGSQTFEKCLLQIEHHRDMLVKAYAKLYESYAYMTTPQVRTSPIEKARREMLEAMPDKLLKMNAAVYLDEDKLADIILPDDREQLINAVLEAMRKGDK